MNKYFNGDKLSGYEDSPITYVYGGNLEECHKVIADLEAKLAEKDRAIENWQTMYQSVMQSCHNGIEEDKRLREQLAEKEKEIATLEVMLAENKNDIKELQEFKVGDDEYDLTDKDARFSLQYDLLNNEQEKISFALEQLEQLRHDIWTNQADDGYTDMQVDLYELNDVIDVRIMQIKEGK